jgi:hypothetical protein
VKIKIRPSVLVISLGLVIALVYAVIQGNNEMVSVLSVALVGALTKLVESEEVSDK